MEPLDENIHRSDIQNVNWPKTKLNCDRITFITFLQFQIGVTPSDKPLVLPALTEPVPGNYL